MGGYGWHVVHTTATGYVALYLHVLVLLRRRLVKHVLRRRRLSKCTTRRAVWRRLAVHRTPHHRSVWTEAPDLARSHRTVRAQGHTRTSHLINRVRAIDPFHRRHHPTARPHRHHVTLRSNLVFGATHRAEAAHTHHRIRTRAARRHRRGRTTSGRLWPLARRRRAGHHVSR